MKERIQEVLRVKDLHGICLCGPDGRWRITDVEIRGIQGALWASGYDPKMVVARIRELLGEQAAEFDLDPEKGHTGTCLPGDIFLLATEGLPKY